MDKIAISGGERLIGEVGVSGAKNAALPLMAATLLTGASHRIKNVPILKDVETLVTLLEHMGAKATFDKGTHTLEVDTSKITCTEAPYDLVKTMRASILVLGPLVARFREARVSLPGGCAIGARPIDLHLMGLKKMGAEVEIDGGYVNVKGPRLRGARIYFETPTVTGTANLMMAATLADGETILENAALEPEVTALGQALQRMGARIKGLGTDVIVIEGVKELSPIDEEVIPDRIEAGTLMVASAMTRGNILISDCPAKHHDALIAKLRDAGTEVKVYKDESRIRVVGDWPIKSVDIKTLPYPGLPTDMQAQMMAMMLRSSGLSVITETVFENRFMHVGELKRMGADIEVNGRCAIVRGVSNLSAAELMATDLRASASLVLAGLVGDGTTKVDRIYHLDRGYECLEGKLKSLGANIERIKE